MTTPLTEPYQPPKEYGASGAEELPIVAVMGLSAGSGVTTLAVNLGAAFSRQGRACVVDLNTQVGQVALQLRMIPPKTTWHSLMSLAPGADKRLIGSALMLAPTAGLAVLAAPVQPVTERLPDETLDYILTVLSEGFHRIVVDLPPVINSMNLMAMKRAQKIVLVVGDDPATLFMAPNALTNIDRMGLSDKVHIVLNHTRPHGVTLDDVVKVTNQPVAANLPYEPAQVEAVTQGVPLVLSQPESLFSRTVTQFVRQL